MRLLTRRKWLPSRVGNSDVRKGYPLISPFTGSRPPLPHTAATSSGIRTMPQPRPERRRSSGAENERDNKAWRLLLFIAMNDFFFMRRLQGLSDLFRDREGGWFNAANTRASRSNRAARSASRGKLQEGL